MSLAAAVGALQLVTADVISPSIRHKIETLCGSLLHVTWPGHPVV